MNELIKEYEKSGCDFNDQEWLKAVALRYAESMDDCQLKCILYVLGGGEIE